MTLNRHVDKAERSRDLNDPKFTIFKREKSSYVVSMIDRLTTVSQSKASGGFIKLL